MSGAARAGVARPAITHAPAARMIKVRFIVFSFNPRAIDGAGSLHASTAGGMAFQLGKDPFVKRPGRAAQVCWTRSGSVFGLKVDRLRDRPHIGGLFGYCE